MGVFIMTYSRKQKWKLANPERWLELKRLESMRARARKAGIPYEEYLNQYGARKLKAETNKANKPEFKIKKCLHSKCPLVKSDSKLDYQIYRAQKKRAQVKRYYYQNLEKARQKVRNYKHNNRQAASDQGRRRNANKKGIVTVEQWDQIKQLFDYKCAYCFRRVYLTQDHFEPLSKGGKHHAANIVPACRSCNSSKHSKGYLMWLLSLGSSVG